MGNDTRENRLEIAKRIKEARKNAGLTQSQVAKKLDLTPQAISNYERGINNVPISILFAMADLYGLKEFSFLDSLPESYQFGKSCIDNLPYDCLQYEFSLNNELSSVCEFERRGVIQEKIRDIAPNEVELFLAEKLQYGTHPDRTDIPVTNAEIDSVGILLDALLYFALEENDPRYENAYSRISNLISLFQAYNKVKAGENFIHVEPFDPPQSDLSLSDFIKKHDPDTPPCEDYITLSHSDNGKPVLILHEVPEPKGKK